MSFYKKKYSVTHMNTDLLASEIDGYYGNRVRSRLRENDKPDHINTVRKSNRGVTIVTVSQIEGLIYKPLGGLLEFLK